MPSQAKNLYDSRCTQVGTQELFENGNVNITAAPSVPPGGTESVKDLYDAHGVKIGEVSSVFDSQGGWVGSKLIMEE